MRIILFSNVLGHCWPTSGQGRPVVESVGRWHVNVDDGDVWTGGDRGYAGWSGRRSVPPPRAHGRGAVRWWPQE